MNIASRKHNETLQTERKKEGFQDKEQSLQKSGIINS
jgi:hypothetical protein